MISLRFLVVWINLSVEGRCVVFHALGVHLGLYYTELRREKDTMHGNGVLEFMLNWVVHWGLGFRKELGGGFPSSTRIQPHRWRLSWRFGTNLLIHITKYTS